MTILNDFQKIQTFIFDIDGVLTDGSIQVFESGEMVRTMNIKDGYALQLAVRKGYRIFIVSGSSPSGVQPRLHYLGIQEVHFKVADKKEFVENIISKNKLQSDHILFMGDDIPDLPVFDVINLSCCPADAAIDIRRAAKYISSKKGGEGCVRDVIEKVLKGRGDWQINSAVASI